jgi:transcriptional regulator with XRE-family HTH domain
MSDEQLKFSPLTIRVKEHIRRLRLDAGYSMIEGSNLLGVSRKQLEDIETTRDYGCHLELELLAKIMLVYKVSLDELIGELPNDSESEFFVRKRRRNAN